MGALRSKLYNPVEGVSTQTTHAKQGVVGRVCVNTVAVNRGLCSLNCERGTRQLGL